MLYIASYVRAQGHQVTVIDALREGGSQIRTLPGGILRVGLSDSQILARIPADADLIGVSVPFSHLAEVAHQLIADIKRERPTTPVVMGGVYPSTQPALAVQSLADFIVLGEGEVPTLGLIEHIRTGRRTPLPDGVIPACEPQKLAGASPFYLKEIESLPRPARDLVPFHAYTGHSARNTRGWRSASIITSRGCPYDCEFCSVHPVCGYRWRARSAQSVLEEIDELADTWQVNLIEIEDDNFTLKADRAMEVLEGIIQRNRDGRKLHWQALNGLRINTLTEPLLRKISESNCRRMCLALENGDSDVLKLMKKRLKLPNVLEVARLVHKYRIPCSVFVIYGYPGETRERFENGLSFYKQLKEAAPSLRFIFFVAQPYPGTRLLSRVVSEGWLPAETFGTVEKMGRFSTERAVLIETEDFDTDEVRRRGRVLRKALFDTDEYCRHRIQELLPDRLVDSLRTAYHVGRRVLLNA